MQEEIANITFKTDLRLTKAETCLLLMKPGSGTSVNNPKAPLVKYYS